LAIRSNQRYLGRIVTIRFVTPLALLLMVTGLSCFGEPPEVKKPKPPDVSATVARFESPTGTLDDQNLPEIVALLGPLTELLETTGLADLLSETLGSLAESPGAAGGAGATGAEQSSFGGEGWLRLTRICSGWTPGATPEPANGTLSLTAGFTDDHLDPVVWGKAEDCHYLVAGRELTLGGSADEGSILTLWVGDDTRIADAASRPMIFSVHGTLTIDGKSEPLALDFGFNPSTLQVSFTVAAGDGEVVAELAGTELVAIRARNGDFACSTDSQQCVSEDNTLTW
jgi:hypothetical protein